MTPLMRLLLRALRAASIVSAGLVVLFIALEVLKNYLVGRLPEGRDWAFLVVLIIMLVGALLLARAISRELRK